MPWYKKLHWQIIIGLVLGLLYGIVAASAGWGQFTSDWVAPFGTIFLNLLQLIAVPLIIASLIVGVASLGDLEQLSRIGGKTLGIYVLTTTIALIVGLVLVNSIEPGSTVPQEMRTQLEQTYQGDIEESMDVAKKAEGRGPLQPLVDMVPSNFFESASDNGNMLQVVFVAISPTDLASLLGALGLYCLTVVIGLAVMVFGVYPLFMSLFTPISIPDYFRAIAPAQLVAFSTSSSGATLPVTMEVSEKNLGVSEEVSSFALPLGATINMDGTALYQAVSAVFIAQVLGISLVFTQQLNIILIAVLASIGTAAVPSAGIVMLVAILESIGVPSAGLALILGVDRPLDMLRTTNNVTGDTMVASVVAASENQLQFPTDGVSVATSDVQGAMRETAVQEDAMQEDAV